MMAIERAVPDEPIPYLDEVYPPASDELPPITAEDIARTVERVEAGRMANAYHFGETDLYVLGRLMPEEWREVVREPGALARILAPLVHA